MSEPSEFSFTFFGGLIQIVAKGVELPLPLSYGLLILLIGIAIRIALPSKGGGLRQLLEGVQEGLSLIRGKTAPTEVQSAEVPKEQQPKKQPEEPQLKADKKPATRTVH